MNHEINQNHHWWQKKSFSRVFLSHSQSINVLATENYSLVKDFSFGKFKIWEIVENRLKRAFLGSERHSRLSFGSWPLLKNINDKTLKKKVNLILYVPRVHSSLLYALCPHIHDCTWKGNVRIAVILFNHFDIFPDHWIIYFPISAM